MSKHASGVGMGGVRLRREFICNKADVIIVNYDYGAGSGFDTDRAGVEEIAMGVEEIAMGVEENAMGVEENAMGVEEVTTDRAGATPLHQGSRTGIVDNEPPEDISEIDEYSTVDFNMVRVNANRTTAEGNVRHTKWFVRVPSCKWDGRFKWDGPFTGKEMVDWYEAGDFRFTQPWGSIMDGAGGVWSTAGAICRARWENDIARWEKHAARWENQAHGGRAEAKGSGPFGATEGDAAGEIYADETAKDNGECKPDGEWKADGEW